MLYDSYILFMIFGFFIFFLGITNTIRLVKQTRILLMMVGIILFFFLAMSSWNIEDKYCTYLTDSAEWTCTTQIIEDIPLALINLMFGAISLIYIIAESFGWIPKEEAPNVLTE